MNTEEQAGTLTLQEHALITSEPVLRQTKALTGLAGTYPRRMGFIGGRMA